MGPPPAPLIVLKVRTANWLKGVGMVEMYQRKELELRMVHATSNRQEEGEAGGPRSLSSSLSKDPVQAQHKRVGGQKGGNRLALCSANL